MSDILKLETNIAEIKQSLQEELDFVLAAKEKVEQYHLSTVEHLGELFKGMMVELNNVAERLHDIKNGKTEPAP